MHSIEVMVERVWFYAATVIWWPKDSQWWDSDLIQISGGTSEVSSTVCVVRSLEQESVFLVMRTFMFWLTFSIFQYFLNTYPSFLRSTSISGEAIREKKSSRDKWKNLNECELRGENCFCVCKFLCLSDYSSWKKLVRKCLFGLWIILYVSWRSLENQ